MSDTTSRHFLKSLLLVCCCSSVFLSSCSSGGGGGGSSASTDACSDIGLPEKVIHGTACAALHRAAVVRFGLVRADGAFAPTCSASVIGPRAVLTASHCIEAFSGRAATGFGIALGEIRSLHIIRASAVAEFPGFFEGNNRLFNDLSIVTLSADTGITPLAVLASRSPAAGDTGLVYGYGKRSEGTDEEADIFTNLVSGTMQVQNVTSNHIFVSYNGSGSNVCNGDSGGPILLSSPQGGFAIAGVVSVGSVEGCRAGDTTTFTNATSAQFLNFISAHAAGVTFK